MSNYAEPNTKFFVQIMEIPGASFFSPTERWSTRLIWIHRQLCHAFGGTAQVQKFIEQTRDAPRLGKAVSIPLDLGERASEWP